MSKVQKVIKISGLTWFERNSPNYEINPETEKFIKKIEQDVCRRRYEEHYNVKLPEDCIFEYIIPAEDGGKAEPENLRVILSKESIEIDSKLLARIYEEKHGIKLPENTDLEYLIKSINFRVILKK